MSNHSPFASWAQLLDHVRKGKPVSYVTNAFEVVEDHGRSSVVCRMGVHGVPNRLRPEIYESYRLFCTAFWLGNQR